MHLKHYKVKNNTYLIELFWVLNDVLTNETLSTMPGIQADATLVIAEQ